MPEPFDVLVVEDFSAGIYRGRKAPPGAVWAAINALLNDEGEMFKRGVTAYYSASDAGSVDKTRLHALFMRAPAANRVVMGSATGGSYVLDGSLAPVALSTGASAHAFWSRAAGIGDFAVWDIAAAGGASGLVIYGGSLKAANYSTGTITVTADSANVTGAGTSFVANIDPGMLIRVGTTYGVVKSVTSDTALVLSTPWPGATAAGTAYLAATAFLLQGAGENAPGTGRGYVASGSGLLLVARGNRVYYTTEFGTSGAFGVNEYHELPANEQIIGLESRGTNVLVFTTGGVWEIQNLYLDAIDDFGNIQRPVEKVNKDVVLWDDFGIAAWDASVVVPSVEDVYLMGPDGSLTVLSEGIRPLYRTYVEGGFQCGMAAVHRGHYFLPISYPGVGVVDLLVCRLDRPTQTPSGSRIFPWTTWDGHALGAAYATLVGGDVRSPKLLSVNGLRVTDLTGCMKATSATGQDANSTTPWFTVETTDFRIGPGVRPSTVSFSRALYETTGGTPVTSVGTATGPEGSTYVEGTLKRGGGASDGTDYSSWAHHRRDERVRARFRSPSQVTSMLLRRLELTVRRNGR